MIVYKTDKGQEYLTDEGCHIIEILNNSDSEKVSIAQARVEPGVKTRLHTLSDTSEIYYILTGEGIATINDESQKLVVGDCVIIQPNIPQCIENTGAVDLTFLCVCNPRFQFSNYKDVGL